MAASRWTGFTEDDLKRIREENELESDNQTRVTSPKNQQSSSVSLTGNKKLAGKKHGTLRPIPRKVVVNDAGVSVLEPSEMLSPPTVAIKNEASEAKQVKLTTMELSQTSLQDSAHIKSLPNSNGLIKLKVKSDGHSVEVMSSKSCDNSESFTDTANQPAVLSAQNDTPILVEDCPNTSGSVQSDVKTVYNKKKVSLEDFQKRQKMIEEQNKRRRAMLSKAISDRKRKTQAETEKLTHIQKELQKLDCLVSSDVAILRNQIEVASLEFNDIQKRYEKAEREFVEAKMELFKKMERKEQLTEHLCTIIEENELRKAKKLADLMNELELESLIDECQQEELVLPQLCALNDITYSYCTTLRDPKSLPVTPTEPNPSSDVLIVAANEAVSTEPENSLSAVTTTELSQGENMHNVSNSNNSVVDEQLNANQSEVN